MNTGTHDVIYDISAVSFNWWPAIFAFGFAAIALAWGLFPTKEIHQSQARAFAPAFFGLVIGGISVFQFWTFLHLREQKRTHDFSIVEGLVEEYEAAPIGRHGDDHFAVAGRSFAVGHRAWSAGYAGTVAGGAPDLYHRCVRIEFTDNGDILWLGVAEPSGALECPIAERPEIGSGLVEQPA
jgi:hypothetical protein